MRTVDWFILVFSAVGALGAFVRVAQNERMWRLQKKLYTKKKKKKK